MNCESLPFFKQPLEYKQIVFITIKVIYNRTNKSGRESGCYIFVNNTFNLNVKTRGNFLSSVQFIYNSIYVICMSHVTIVCMYECVCISRDFWCSMYRELLHFIVHLSCNFAVTSNNLCIKELGWIQF